MGIGLDFWLQTPEHGLMWTRNSSLRPPDSCAAQEGAGLHCPLCQGLHRAAGLKVLFQSGPFPHRIIHSTSGLDPDSIILCFWIEQRCQDTRRGKGDWFLCTTRELKSVKTWAKSSTLHLHLELQADITQESVHQVLASLLSNPADDLPSSSDQHHLY